MEEKLSKDKVRSLLQMKQVGLGGDEPLTARGEANRKQDAVYVTVCTCAFMYACKVSTNPESFSLI